MVFYILNLLLVPPPLSFLLYASLNHAAIILLIFCLVGLGLTACSGFLFKIVSKLEFKYLYYIYSLVLEVKNIKKNLEQMILKSTSSMIF